MKNSPFVNSCVFLIEKSAGDFPANHVSFRKCTTRDAPSSFPRISWWQTNPAKNNQTWAKKTYMDPMGLATIVHSHPKRGSCHSYPKTYKYGLAGSPETGGPPKSRKSFERSKQIIQLLGFLSPWMYLESPISNLILEGVLGVGAMTAMNKKAPTSLPWGFEKSCKILNFTLLRKHISSNQFSFFFNLPCQILTRWANHLLSWDTSKTLKLRRSGIHAWYIHLHFVDFHGKCR